MKRSMNAMAAALALMSLLPIGSVFAQKSLSQVPIKYPGDTDATIARRAQWIEGAKKEGTVVWWCSIKPNQLNEIAAAFNKVYPFIKLEYWTGEEKERVTRIETEHSIGRITFDLSDPGEATRYPRWRSIGLIEKYTDIIPLIEKKDKRMYSKYGDWVQLGHNAITPQYNTKLLSASGAPKSWDDLLNPKWKGQLGMTTAMDTWIGLALGDGGWGVEKTEDFLHRLKQQNIIYGRGRTAVHNLMIAGEFKVNAECNLLNYFQSKMEGAPAEWVRVNPVLITGAAFIMPKKVPHPNGARLFLEWMFSPQGLAIFEEVTGKGAPSPGSGTLVAKAIDGLPLVYWTEEVRIKGSELNLEERFAKILGVTPE